MFNKAEDISQPSPFRAKRGEHIHLAEINVFRRFGIRTTTHIKKHENNLAISILLCTFVAYFFMVEIIN